MIFSLIIGVVVILSYLIFISIKYGKISTKLDETEKELKRYKNAKIISHISDDDINKLYDKYE